MIAAIRSYGSQDDKNCFFLIIPGNQFEAIYSKHDEIPEIVHSPKILFIVIGRFDLQQVYDICSFLKRNKLLLIQEYWLHHTYLHVSVLLQKDSFS